SRRRHTRLQGDWSSDVCSSDLSVWPAALTLLCQSQELFSRNSMATLAAARLCRCAKLRIGRSNLQGPVKNSMSLSLLFRNGLRGEFSAWVMSSLWSREPPKLWKSKTLPDLSANSAPLHSIS